MTSGLQAERLELITLNDAIVSFSRLYANTVRYHHWHQCWKCFMSKRVLAW